MAWPQFGIRRLGLAVAWAALACWLIRASTSPPPSPRGPGYFNPILMLGFVVAAAAIGMPFRLGSQFAIAALPVSLVVQGYVANYMGKPLPQQLHFAADAAKFLGFVATAYLVARWLFRRWTRAEN